MKLAEIDPRVKLLMLVLISSFALICRSLLPLVALLAITLLFLLTGGVSLSRIWQQSRLAFSLILLLFLMQCIFNRSGEPFLVVKGFTVFTSGGLQMGAAVSLRLLIVVSSALIVLTGQLRDYLLALRWVHVPWEICYMLLAALRFIPLLREEAQDTAAAMQMRGCDIKAAPLLQKARLYVSMLAPVTAGALQRAEAMSISMEARAFRSQKQRSSWRSLHFTTADAWYLAAFLLVMAVYVWLVFFLW